MRTRNVGGERTRNYNYYINKPRTRDLISSGDFRFQNFRALLLLLPPISKILATPLEENEEEGERARTRVRRRMRRRRMRRKERGRKRRRREGGRGGGGGGRGGGGGAVRVTSNT